MLDPLARRLIDPPLDRLGARLASTGIGADRVTLAGFGLGLGAVAAIAFGLFGLGLVLLVLNRLFDGLDGAVARRTGVTDLGGFLDIVLDFIVYSGIVFGFALADPGANALAAAFLIFSFIGTGTSFLAFAIMAERRGLSTESQGKKSLYYLSGLAEGTETVAALGLFCLFPAAFAPLAVAFGAICWLSTLGRVIVATRLLRAR